MAADEGLKRALAHLESPTASSMLKLHSEIRLALAVSGRIGKIARLLRGALLTAERLHSFLVEIETSRKSKGHAEKASILELASIGGLTLQDFTGELQEKTLPRLLLAGISQGLAYMGTREFVKAGQAGIEGLLSRTSFLLQEELWAILEDAELSLGPGDSEDVGEGFHRLCASLGDPRTPADRRASLAVSVYILLLRLRMHAAMSAARAD